MRGILQEALKHVGHSLEVLDRLGSCGPLHFTTRIINFEDASA
jgi:hypothetical protein